MIRILPCAAAAGLVLAFLTQLFIPAGAAHAQSATVSLESYRQTLEEVRQDIDALEDDDVAARTEIVGRLEQIRQVKLSDGEVVPVDHAYLAGLLTSDPAQTDRFLANLDAILAALNSEPQAADLSPAALDVLDRILAADKYQWASPEPNPLQTLLQNGFEWLARLVNRLFPNIADASMWLNAALAGLFAAIVAAILFFVYRATARSILKEARAAAENRIPGALTAEQALVRAQERSEKGDFRTAVRYLYLSALLSFEARGLLRIDRSRTNHEVLTDLARQPELAAELEEVVEVFDRVWYGFQAIDAQAFERYAERVRRLKTRREAAE